MAISRCAFISLLECIKHYAVNEQRMCRPTGASAESSQDLHCLMYGFWFNLDNNE